LTRWFAGCNRPASIPLKLILSAQLEVTFDGQEPARDALGVRQRIP
jgi:hypothetical protein